MNAVTDTAPRATATAPRGMTGPIRQASSAAAPLSPGGGTGESLNARPHGQTREHILRFLTWAGAALAIGALLYIVAFILIRGVPYLKPSLFAWEYTSDNVSLMPALVSTIVLTVLSLVIALPLGVPAAIWLAEYAPRGSRLVSLVRMMSDTLAGIPSIVYGLFGLLFFVGWLGWGFSVLAGAATLAIMILPLTMRSTEEALRAVPDGWREAAFGLGAGRLRTTFRVVLPAAMPGILAGVILAVGRIVGETAALIYTAGTVAQVPGSPMESARTLSVHMYALSSEGLHLGEGYATAVVLLVVVIGINAVSAAIAKRITR
ncbi:MAG: phosphate ABC transporter permease PstA [Propionibacteriaceae bacterium]|jgi:phosphate transport system permease protein|nr:phosphate ABC transporter permease PstA [Propionibacteriaceae bacterium]